MIIILEDLHQLPIAKCKVKVVYFIKLNWYFVFIHGVIMEVKNPNQKADRVLFLG